LDEVANAEVQSMLPVHYEGYLSLLWIINQDPASCEVFAGRQVRQIQGEEFGIRLDDRAYS